MSTSRHSTRVLAAAAVVALAVAAGVPSSAQVSAPIVQGVPLVQNPPAGYPYPNVASSTVPQESASGTPSTGSGADTNAAPGSTLGTPAATGSGAPVGPAGEPNVDPTSKAPNTYGTSGGPPKLQITGQEPDTSAHFAIRGPLGDRYVVTLHQLGAYRQDTVRTANGTYTGVALQFLPGVSRLAHAPLPSSEALVAFSPARITVTGSDGVHATFRSSELIDAQGDPRIFLATRRSGVGLGSDGPFRVVAPHDTSRMRWIKNVVAIEVDR